MKDMIIKRLKTLWGEEIELPIPVKVPEQYSLYESSVVCYVMAYYIKLVQNHFVLNESEIMDAIKSKNYLDVLSGLNDLYTTNIGRLIIAIKLGDKKSKKEFKRILKQIRSPYTFNEAVEKCYDIWLENDDIQCWFDCKSL